MKHVIFCILLNLALIPFSAAQSYPTKSISIVVAVAPGGVVDLVARAMARKLTVSLGQPVTVENRPGAGGSVGLDMVARAAPDGYTLGVGWNSPLAINASMMKDLAYDPVADFAPISTVATYPLYVAVKESLPVESMRELVDYAKANPGKLNFASSGSFTILGAALMSSMADIRMNIVPFNGNGPALVSLLGGHVDVMMATLMPRGAVKILAVTSEHRLDLVPGIPTVAESAIPGFDVTGWLGFVAPKGTPVEIVGRLNTEISRALESEDVRRQLEAQQLQVKGSSPEEFAAVIQRDVSKWAKVVKEAGIQPQ